jgi:hypothetical protein
MSEESAIRRFSGTIAFIVCFVIGCLFLYWAVEYWVYNSFDSNRYELSKIQVGNSDSLSTWKLDKRTGNLEYCTKSYEKMDHFVCVRSVTIDAKEFAQTVQEMSRPAVVAATTPAVAAAPPAEATAPAQAATTPAEAQTATTPAEAANTQPVVDEAKQPARPVAAKAAPLKPAHGGEKKKNQNRQQ